MGLIIGAHVSFKGDTQLLGSVAEALEYKANTFMFYTGAPQNTTRAIIDEEITSLAQTLMEKEGINKDNIIIHAPYIINLASGDNKFAIDFLKEEINRTERLGVSKIVVHPGSHVGQGIEQGIQNIIRALNVVIDNKTEATICLETMAGKGTEVGSTFEEIKQIINGVNHKEKLGVCLDTCHINDNGYDINNFDEVLNQFDKIIGLPYLKCIHINDSKNIIASHKDRHENIGLGNIGFDNLIKIIYNDRLINIPKILETPYVTIINNDKTKSYPPYKAEIEMIRNRTFNDHLIKTIQDYYQQ